MSDARHCPGCEGKPPKRKPCVTLGRCERGHMADGRHYVAAGDPKKCPGVEPAARCEYPEADGCVWPRVRTGLHQKACPGALWAAAHGSDCCDMNAPPAYVPSEEDAALVEILCDQLWGDAKVHDSCRGHALAARMRGQT